MSNHDPYSDWPFWPVDLKGEGLTAKGKLGMATNIVKKNYYGINYFFGRVTQPFWRSEFSDAAALHVFCGGCEFKPEW